MHSEPLDPSPGSPSTAGPGTDLRAQLIAAIEGYALKAKLKPSTVSTYAAGSGRFYGRLKAGKPFGSVVAERVLGWIRDAEVKLAGEAKP